MLDKVKTVILTIWGEYKSRTNELPKFIQYAYLGIMGFIICLSAVILYDFAVLLGGVVVFGAPMVSLWLNYREIRNPVESNKSLEMCMLFTTITAVAWLVLLVV